MRGRGIRKSSDAGQATVEAAFLALSFFWGF